jgi:hypothetical protein
VLPYQSRIDPDLPYPIFRHDRIIVNRHTFRMLALGTLREARLAFLVVITVKYVCVSLIMRVPGIQGVPKVLHQA